MRAIGAVLRSCEATRSPNTRCLPKERYGDKVKTVPQLWIL
jgi:hypothetical protein